MIWDIKDWLSQLIIYAEKKQLSTNITKKDMNNLGTEALGNVIGCAMHEDATVSEELKEHFVNSINYDTNAARTKMMAVKNNIIKKIVLLLFMVTSLFPLTKQLLK